MTAFTWAVRGRWASAISADPAANTAVILPWSPDAAFVGTVPWASPAYPVLRIMAIGVTVGTSGTAGTRRLKVHLDSPILGFTEFYSSASQAANTTRRYEFAALSETLSVTPAGFGATPVSRENLPLGFDLFPGIEGGVEGQLVISIDNGQTEDDMTAVCVRGLLLPHAP